MNRRFAVLLLILLGFTLNAVVPKGFMRSFDANGKIAMVICSGVDQKVVYIDQEQSPEEGSNETTDEPQDSCPVNIVQKTLPLIPSDVALVKALPFQATYTVELYNHIVAAIAHDSLSRAPPFFV